MALALLVVPLVGAALAAFVPSNRWRPWVLPLTAAVHVVLVALAVRSSEPITTLTVDGRPWLVLDALGAVVLGAVSVLHFLCMAYAPGYLNLRGERDNRVLCTSFLVQLSMMTLVIMSHHMGLMWVAVEATTLVSAPSLYFNHNPRSLEATWKYLLLCSVGIAVALLGSFFLAYSALVADQETTLHFDDLLLEASRLSKPWLHAAFALLLVGYGAKMGLAPMHNWKPDAYGEAPGMVGALLAGGVTNCAFLAILRIYQVCAAAGEAEHCQRIMVFMGLLSVAVAGVFMIRQRDFKRLLAYSSVEHMGVLVFGVGVGGAATFGALLHIINNALTKGVLFLSAGNIHRAYRSKSVEQVRGALRLLPLSGSLLVAGFIAGCGSPPFAPFVSEFTILATSLATQPAWIGALFLVLLLLAFVGMGSTVLAVALGPSSLSREECDFPDDLRTGLPILIFMGLVLLLGVYLPPDLQDLVARAAAHLNDPSAVSVEN